MPLRDHFHEPIDLRAQWQSFHNRWANAIADRLDSLLPPRYAALVEINLGRDVAADVAEFEAPTGSEPNGSHGGVAVQAYAPPVVGLVLPVVYPDIREVQVRDIQSGNRLAAVVELVSPSNKDRPETRLAFAAKIAAYLQTGVGVVIVDAVTTHHFNLHDEFVGLMELAADTAFPDAALPYAVAYRPTRRAERDEIDVWPRPLTIGGELPVLPLALRGNGCVPLDLEATYQDTCRRSRLI